MSFLFFSGTNDRITCYESTRQAEGTPAEEKSPEGDPRSPRGGINRWQSV
ncbi:MAG: hypothetical protein O2955_19230 [Planctomycetota bacterium]|nr:hypothetical protein [Planctomycetota bacterium]MDA1214647.1 hypothetical protein [Planctomycetota bacterium]